MSLFPSPFDHESPSSFDHESWERWLQQRRKHFFETSLWNGEHFGLPSPSPIEPKALLEFPKLSISSTSSSSDKSKPLTVINQDGFTACVDIQHFQPNEVTVKTVKNTVIVEAKHEDREDEHGFITRSFYRKYILPDGYDPQSVVSTLSSDGVLTIKAPKPVAAIDDKERVVQIQQTGPSNTSDEKPAEK